MDLVTAERFLKELAAERRAIEERLGRIREIETSVRALFPLGNPPIVLHELPVTPPKTPPPTRSYESTANVGMLDRIKAHLAKRRLTNRELAEVLESEGITATGKTPLYQLVASATSRLVSQGLAIRIGQAASMIPEDLALRKDAEPLVSDFPNHKEETPNASSA